MSREQEERTPLVSLKQKLKLLHVMCVMHLVQ